MNKLLIQETASHEIYMHMTIFFGHFYRPQTKFGAK